MAKVEMKDIWRLIGVVFWCLTSLAFAVAGAYLYIAHDDWRGGAALYALGWSIGNSVRMDIHKWKHELESA